MGLRQPTVTRSLGSLATKGFVDRRAGGGRAVALAVSAEGRACLDRMSQDKGAAAIALAALSGPEKSMMMAAVTKMIRAWQESGVIEPQRLCATCRHFQPNIHQDDSKPHHCGLVDSAFGNRDLRLDCSDHEPADAAGASRAWRIWSDEPDAPTAETDGASFLQPPSGQS